MTLVTQKELSNIIGITTRQIRNLRGEHGLFDTHGDTKKYNLAVCVQEYIRFKVECESGSQNIIYESERAEHERAKKDITKLKLRKLKKELHEAVTVEIRIADMLTCFKSKLLSMPPKLAPQLVGQTSAHEIMNMLKQEVYEALGELSEYNADDYSDDTCDYWDEDEEEDYEET